MNKLNWKSTAFISLLLIFAFATASHATDYYKSLDNKCGLTISSDDICTLNISPSGFCGPGYFYPTQECSDSPAHTGCIAETSVTSCGVCGDCVVFEDTCQAVACGTTNSYGCGVGKVCSGQAVGAGECATPDNGNTCYCDSMCTGGYTCEDGTCTAPPPDLSFDVHLNYPADGTVNESTQTIEVGYTPTWADGPIEYCQLFVNDANVTDNQTELVNDTINTITYDFGSDGYYKLFIDCNNGSTGHSSEISYIYVNTAQLVANWTFDEGQGGTTDDASIFGNNCTINNASWISGVQGNALDFNGFDSYLDCGNDTSLNFGTGDFTIMAWVNSPNVTDYNGFIVAKTDDNENYLGYQLFESGDVNGAEANFYSQDNFDAYGTSVITDNTWHFVVGVYNSSNLSAYIYVNGVLEAVVEGNGNDTSNIANLLIGNDGSSFFNGTIDEVKIWNEAKDGAFVLQTYNDEKPASITCNSPANSSTQISVTEVDYTPIWYGTPFIDCELWVNGSDVYGNQTAIINGTINSISYNHGDGYWEDQVTCNDGTNTYFSPLIYFTVDSSYVSDLSFSVSWNSPLNGTTNDSSLITVEYTPIWHDGELTGGCSLWVNSSAVEYNDTTLINDSINSITYDYGTDGSYESYINCANGTDNNWTVTTYFSIDTTAPSQVTGVTSGSKGTTWIYLTWSAATDTGSGVAKYMIWRDGVNIANSTSTHYNDTGLTSGVAYHYLVGAVDHMPWYGLNSTLTNIATLTGSGGTGGRSTGGSPATTKPSTLPMSTTEQPAQPEDHTTQIAVAVGLIVLIMGVLVIFKRK